MEENSMGAESSQVIASKNSIRKKFLIGCGALILLSICCCVLVLGNVGLSVYQGGFLDTLTVDYSIPSSVAKGEHFELVLTLTNTGSSDIQVNHIDLDQVVGGSILDGSTIISSDPPIDRYVSGPGYQSFVYHLPIPPGESRQVTLVLEAVNVGQFGGPIGIFVGDNDKGQQTNNVTITITEE
jgi:hypothetical protein